MKTKGIPSLVAEKENKLVIRKSCALRGGYITIVFEGGGSYEDVCIDAWNRKIFIYQLARNQRSQSHNLKKLNSAHNLNEFKSIFFRASLNEEPDGWCLKFSLQEWA